MYYNWSAFKSQNDQSRHAWEPWGAETSSNSAINYPLNHSLFNYSPPPPPADGVSAAMMNRGSSPLLVGGEGESGEPRIYYNLDPHLMCLKLGKRQYFEDVTGVTSSTPIVIEDDTAAVGHGVSPVERKGKTSYGDAPPMAPRCQVEGCETGLVNAKDYHRRHKVCQMHAKAPKVVVLGIAQRFCQQCSRFHAVEQFDDSKRSCRRRLAGHNERRRKSSLNQPHLLGKLQQGLHHLDSSLSSSECALSLLSSGNIYAPWNPTASQDLPARCSAALRDLIAENRASRQLVGTFNPGSEQRQSLTLDLMLDPNSPFGHLSNRLPSAEGREDGGDFWKVTSQY